MINPNQYAIQKYMFDVLQDRYADNKDIIERVSHSLVTQNDLKGWSNLIGDIFEKGFMKATEQYSEQMEKLGYTLIIEKKD